MAVPLLLVGGAVAAIALLGGGGAGAVRWWRRRRMQSRITNEGAKEVANEEKEETQLIHGAGNKAERDIERAAGEKEPVKDKLLESGDEEEIVKDAGTEQEEKTLDADEKAEGQLEEETEKEKKKLPKDIKNADKQANGGERLKGVLKKEEKKEIKITKEEAEEAEIAQEIERTVFKDLKEALLLTSSLEVLAKDVEAQALLEQRQQEKEEQLSRKIEKGLSSQLGRFASLSALNNYTINWMRNYFWPLIFREFEEKLYTTAYSQKVEEHLLPRVHAALRVAKKSIENLESSRRKLSGLVADESSDSKKAIRDIKKLIHLKKKELRKIKRHARSAKEHQLIVQLSKEIHIMSQYLSRMETAQKRVSETSSFMKKNVVRIKAALLFLQAYSLKILRMERQLEKITAKVKKQINSVEKLIHESRMKIEELHLSDRSSEELIVEAAKMTKEFFEKYDRILEVIIKFDSDLKEIMNASFNMAYRERAVFFLLEALETAQDGILGAVRTIIGMSRTILSSRNILNRDMQVFLSDLDKSESLIQNAIRNASYLNRFSAYVSNLMRKTRAALESEILFLQGVRARVQKEGKIILENLNAILRKLVHHMKRIDKNYISRFDTTHEQIKEFHSAAEEANKARKLAA